MNRTSGLKIASDGLKGRVFEVSLADLNQVRALDHTLQRIHMSAFPCVCVYVCVCVCVSVCVSVRECVLARHPCVCLTSCSATISFRSLFFCFCNDAIFLRVLLRIGRVIAQEDQAVRGGRPGQERAHQLPRHGPHDRQAQVADQEVEHAH